jgi:hypothetical protein
MGVIMYVNKKIKGFGFGFGFDFGFDFGLLKTNEPAH